MNKAAYVMPDKAKQKAIVPSAFCLQDLQPYNTLHLPARAPVLCLRDESQIERLGSMPGRDGLPLFVLGGGSNIVLPPRPRCQFIKVELRGVRLLQESADHRLIEAAAGEPWHGFVDFCLRQGWPGLENLALIPGTLGAAPVQNIGAYGLELAERVHSVVAWDLHSWQRHELSPADCRFAYRDSLFKQAGPGRWLIVRVRLKLPKRWCARLDYPDLRDHPDLQHDPSARQVFAAVCEIRQRKLPDPAVLANAGSFFKNPRVSRQHAQSLRLRFPDLPSYPEPDGRVKLAAGWLLDKAGWRGRRLGPVGMHMHQALVLVNHGGADADDVWRLAHAVQQDVRQRFDVQLEPEPVAVPALATGAET